MSNSKAKEFSMPRQLFKNKGAFYEMVIESRDKVHLEKMILG
jgi:hypothetical protein